VPSSLCLEVLSGGPIVVVHVLENPFALGLLNCRGVSPRQFVERFLNAKAHRRARLLALAPIQHELLRLQGIQHLLGESFYLSFLRGGDVRTRLGQDVEDGQFFFGQLFADVALSFLIKLLGEFEQLLVDRLGVGRPSSINRWNFSAKSTRILFSRGLKGGECCPFRANRRVGGRVPRAIALGC
jgi:hypothetical protein